jgi:hypothetical protein
MPSVCAGTNGNSYALQGPAGALSPATACSSLNSIPLLLAACICRQGSLPSATSTKGGEGLCPNLHVRSTASRLQHTHSAATDASTSASSSLRRTATISRPGSAQGPELGPALQRRASSPSVSAPGLEGFGMYRASGLLLPLNLSYMPKSLTKCVLQGSCPACW